MIYPRETETRDIDLFEHDINMDFEENSSHPVGVMSNVCQKPDKSYFQAPPELRIQMDTSTLEQNLLPKQIDIDKVWK